MATIGKNLSHYDQESIPNGSDYKIGIAVSEWNNEITTNLLNGALKTLIENGVKQENITVRYCPGSFELALASQFIFEGNDLIDGTIAIGSVIQGETKHFDFVCNATANGIMDVSLKFNKPVIFCVLTDNTIQQAIDRSGGKYGNKGVEAAIACLKMIAIKSIK